MEGGGLQTLSSLALKRYFLSPPPCCLSCVGLSNSLCLVTVTVRVGISLVADEVTVCWVVSGKPYANCSGEGLTSVF